MLRYTTTATDLCVQHGISCCLAYPLSPFPREAPNVLIILYQLLCNRITCLPSPLRIPCHVILLQLLVGRDGRGGVRVGDEPRTHHLLGVRGALQLANPRGEHLSRRPGQSIRLFTPSSWAGTIRLPLREQLQGGVSHIPVSSLPAGALSPGRRLIRGFGV